VTSRRPRRLGQSLEHAAVLQGHGLAQVAGPDRGEELAKQLGSDREHLGEQVPFDLVLRRPGGRGFGQPLAQVDQMFQSRFDIAFGVCIGGH